MKYCKDKQTKAAYAERAIKFLRDITNRGLEDQGSNFVAKWQQYVSKNNGRKISIWENPCEMSKPMTFNIFV